MSKVINEEPLFAGIITYRYSNVMEWADTKKKIYRKKENTETRKKQKTQL